MRWWPKSLLGQVLLAVSIGLLVAQAISAVLLYRAGEDRREQRMVGSLAVQLIAASNAPPGTEVPRGRLRAGPRGWRKMRVEISAANPALPSDRADPSMTAALRSVLVEQGLAGGERVAVARRDALRDPRVLARLASGRGLGRNFALTDADVILASLRRDDGTWVTARAIAPEREPAALRGLLLQTTVLFGVLLLAMWLLLRRITRPLAALTDRLEQFARTQRTDGQIAPEGPDDIRRLIAAHNTMEWRIAAMLDEKDVMLGAIGHDLKTPLAALRVRIESVEDEAERARMAMTIEDITRSLDDILALARVGRTDAPPERTDLAALTAAVVEEFEDMSEPVELGDTPRLVRAVHVTWLRRALRNLIANAVRYGGAARVSLVEQGGQAVLRIEDSGPGIPEHRIADMLEPFQRGEASRNRETGGAGLGLALARAIAEQHGGALVLANRPGGGLRAELRIP